MRSHHTHFLNVWEADNPSCIGVGEAAPLPGLSLDYQKVPEELSVLCKKLTDSQSPTNARELADLLDRSGLAELPSLKFALEVAMKDLLSGGKAVIYPGAFTSGEKPIPINGLVWMGSFDFMKQQVDQKVAEGYKCIKIKVGAIDFAQECKLLEYIRTSYDQDISLRIDANGAFNDDNVVRKLEALSHYNLHSIEQPVKPGQHRLMRNLSDSNIVPVALDEELIGVTSPEKQRKLLEEVRPQYIVLKPTLLGGLQATRAWINLAMEMDIGWWITSALESNVGLNALAQFTATFNPEIPQGLGTGQLYHNNTATRLSIREGYLYYNP